MHFPLITFSVLCSAVLSSAAVDAALNQASDSTQKAAADIAGIPGSVDLNKVSQDLSATGNDLQNSASANLGNIADSTKNALDSATSDISSPEEILKNLESKYPDIKNDLQDAYGKGSKALDDFIGTQTVIQGSQATALSKDISALVDDATGDGSKSSSGSYPAPTETVTSSPSTSSKSSSSSPDSSSDSSILAVSLSAILGMVGLITTLFVL